jgi:hypothetical protein
LRFVGPTPANAFALDGLFNDDIEGGMARVEVSGRSRIVLPTSGSQTGRRRPDDGRSEAVKPGSRRP